MKLLLDQNLSFRLARSLQDFPIEVDHLSSLGLLNFKDHDVWAFAKKNNYAIVTFDVDFFDLLTLNGFPPKIIWLRAGNSTRKNLMALLNSNSSSIEQFIVDSEVGCLELY